MKICPECGVKVRLDKIENHMKKVHPQSRWKDVLTEEERESLIQKNKELERKPISKKEMALYISALIAVIVIVLVVVFYKPPSSVAPGKDAPDFIVKDTDGNTFHLQAERGRVILLNMMDTRCSHCERETRDVLVSLHSKYSSSVIFFSVDVQIMGPDTVSSILDFKSRTGATWRYALDTDKVREKYEIDATPTLFIIDRNGKIFFQHVGESDFNGVSAQLDKALGG